MTGQPGVDKFLEGTLWLVGTIVVVTVLAGLVIWGFRRRLRPESTRGSLLDLNQLEAMRERGELSDAEFDHLRRHLLGAKVSQSPPRGSEGDR